jgi:hypothetical protein
MSYIKITPDNAPALVGRNVWINDIHDVDGLDGVITGWEKTPYYSRMVVETHQGIRKYMIAFENALDSRGMHLMNNALDEPIQT